MLDKYGVGQDRYCYAESDILVNLFDIRDATKLAQAEAEAKAEFSAERYRIYQSPQLSSADFNLNHLKKLHRHLFQDIYGWAG